jgi:inner membrane transporter RhtA
LKTFQAVIPICATILAMAAFQSGASVAKGLFPAVGAQGAASLRLLIGATILVLITRPWTAWPPRAARASILLLGVCMAAAVLAFYLALERLPQGVCIAIQFLGPLAVAIGGSRRVRDLLWAALAAIGVACLLSVGRLGVADPLGIALALTAAVGWGGYIVVGRRVSSIGGGPGTAALAMSVAAAIMLPIGLERAGPALFAPSHLALALLVGALAAAIPFPLELFALSRLPARTFAVLMSLEPAFGALSGFVLLGQHLRATQVMGVAAVVIAAIGATLTGAAPAIPSPCEGEIV